MALNDIQINRRNGGLGRQLPNEDHVSMIFDGSILPPASWGTDMARSYTRVEDVEADGIVQWNPTYGLLHYQVKEFFRIAPGRKLWVSFSDYDKTIFAVTQGEVRQFGCLNDNFYADDMQGLLASMEALHAPAVGIVGLFSTTAIDPATLPDLSTSTNPQVAVLATGDFSSGGAALATSLGVDYVPALGAALGAVAQAAVHESVMWVEKFDLQKNGDELERIALPDGTEATATILDDLASKRYLVLRKHIGIAGTYLNDSLTATAATDDYGTIENNRTVQKAMRQVRTALLPKLGQPLQVDSETGQLANGTVKYLESIAQSGIQPMINAGELSDGVAKIDPAQDVLSTSQVQVAIELVPFGVARKFIVNIGLTAQIQ